MTEGSLLEVLPLTFSNCLKALRETPDDELGPRFGRMESEESVCLLGEPTELFLGNHHSLVQPGSLVVVYAPRFDPLQVNGSGIRHF